MQPRETFEPHNEFNMLALSTGWPTLIREIERKYAVAALAPKTKVPFRCRACDVIASVLQRASTWFEVRSQWAPAT